MINIGSAAETIPSFQIEFSEEEKERILQYHRRILDCGCLILGPLTEEFEAAFADFIQTKWAVAVSTGTSALEIIYRCLDVAGKRVLVPSNTNFATAIAAQNAGARLQLYDSGLYPDVEDIERQLSDMKDVAVVVVVHIAGFMSPALQRLRTLCDRHGVLLVEDAAHAHGSEMDGLRAGTFGKAGAYSFVASKVFTTGEGGMIVTDDEKIARMARQFRNQGYGADHLVHKLHGNSWRMTEMSAAMGLVQLDRLITRRDHMQKIISLYAGSLRRQKVLQMVTEDNNCVSSGYKCLVLARSPQEKNTFIETMHTVGLQQTRGVYDMPLHRQPLFAWAIAQKQKFPQADDFSSRHIGLPLWRTMSLELAHDVSDRLALAVERFTETLHRGGRGRRHFKGIKL